MAMNVIGNRFFTLGGSDRLYDARELVSVDVTRVDITRPDIHKWTFTLINHDILCVMDNHIGQYIWGLVHEPTDWEGISDEDWCTILFFFPQLSKYKVNQFASYDRAMSII